MEKINSVKRHFPCNKFAPKNEKQNIHTTVIRF